MSGPVNGPMSGDGEQSRATGATGLAVIPVRDGVLPLGADETVTEVGGAALLIGSGCAEAAAALGAIATSLWAVETDRFEPGRWARTLAGVLDDPGLDGPVGAGHVLLPASPDGRDLGPRLAAALDWDFVAAVTALEAGAARVTRYGGRVGQTLGLDRPVVATLQPGVCGVEADHSPDRIGPEVVPVAEDHDRDRDRNPDPRLIEVLPADPSTMDLAEAHRIVGGGAGLGSAEAFTALRRLADRLGASTGGTRVVTDWGWLPVERQIGTTGVTVDPELYLAVGISGAVQHTAGLGSPAHIVSVNTDPHCPMMAMADLAIVCDGPAFMTELLARLDRS